MHNSIIRKLILLFCLTTVSFSFVSNALATDEAQYAMTNSFISKLNSEGVKYTYLGMDDDDDELVQVRYTTDALGSYTLNFYFDGEDFVQIYVWNLVEANAGKNFTLNTVNTLNNKYNFVTFTLDEEDLVLDAQATFYVGVDAGDVVYKTMNAINNIFRKDFFISAVSSIQ